MSSARRAACHSPAGRRSPASPTGEGDRRSGGRGFYQRSSGCPFRHGKPCHQRAHRRIVARVVRRGARLALLALGKIALRQTVHRTVCRSLTPLGRQGYVALRANYILPCGQITYHAARGLHTVLRTDYIPRCRVDYIPPCGRITCRPADGLHAALRADYIPRYAWITCRPADGLHTALRVDYMPLCERITYCPAGRLHAMLRVDYMPRSARI